VAVAVAVAARAIAGRATPPKEPAAARAVAAVAVAAAARAIAGRATPPREPAAVRAVVAAVRAVAALVASAAARAVDRMERAGSRAVGFGSPLGRRLA